MNFRILAHRNVRGDWHRYTAYYLSSAFTVMIFFIYATFIFHPEIANGAVGGSLRIGLILCEYLIIIFSFFFILYSTTAFLKTRKREFGLLILLGTTRKQINKMVFYENTIISLVAIGTGMVFGALLSKLFFMAIGALLALDHPLTFVIAPKAIWTTFISFFVLFEVLTACALISIGRSEIIDLLKAAKKPRPFPTSSKWLALLSVLCLGGAYYLAWNTAHQGMATRILLLTVFGTYFLFTQGSVTILRRLQKNRRLYYKQTHLLTVSQLTYRLKDNARTLFNVAILSAVVLSATGTFYTLYQGLWERNVQLYPHAISLTQAGGSDQQTIDPHAVEQLFNEQGIRVTEKDTMIGFIAPVMQDQTDTTPTSLFVMANSDYNSRAAGMKTVDQLKVAKGHAVLVTPYPELAVQTHNESFEVTVGVADKDFRFNVVEQRHIPILNQRDRALTPKLRNAYLLIVNDNEYEDLLQNVPDKDKVVYYGYELENWEQSREAVEQIQALFPEEQQISFSSRVEPYLAGKRTYGLIFFIGLFVSVLFFIAAGSVLYFKLFTELQEDQAQYRALRRIGMTVKEMKKMTTVQIGVMFFLPFFVGVIHAAFALKVLANMLAMNVWHYGLVVAVVYFLAQLVYFWLSRNVYLQQLTKI